MFRFSDDGRRLVDVVGYSPAQVFSITGLDYTRNFDE